MIIHRPKYDDWTFPKGKLEEGESFEDAVARELAEETGWKGDLGAELEPTRYKDAEDRDKLVRWWELWVRERRLGAERRGGRPNVGAALRGGLLPHLRAGPRARRTGSTGRQRASLEREKPDS